MTHKILFRIIAGVFISILILSASSEQSIPDPFETHQPTKIISPSLSSIPSVRFAVIGDYGIAGEPLEQVSKLIDSWGVDFIITTGDNNYYGGKAETIDQNIGQYFHEYIWNYQGIYGSGSIMTNRFFPSLGNHDWEVENAQPYIDYFTLPGNEYYYHFRWLFLDFYSIDSDYRNPDSGDQNSVQANWLKRELEKSTGDWQIVYFHHPPYSSGRHPLWRMRWPFEEWGADIVMSGHDHLYERLQIGDIPYFINGLGGGRIDSFDGIFPGSQVRYQSNHGAMLIEATPFEMLIKFINIDGEIIDTYRLPKLD